MRIQFSKKLPSTRELTEILEQRFSNHYSVKTFGLGKKSVLIGKSTFIGAEVSVNENEVSIAESPPSVLSGILLALGLIEFAIFFLPFLIKENFAPYKSYRALEKEIGLFLKETYG